MAAITKFEDLKTWQESQQLNISIFKLVNSGKFAHHDHIRIQMERSAGSIMDNIAEGFERGGNKELIQFLYYSKGSCGELRSQIHRSLDYGLIDQTGYREIIEECESVSKKIHAFIAYLRSSSYKGEKYNVSEPDSIYETKSSSTGFEP